MKDEIKKMIVCTLTNTSAVLIFLVIIAIVFDGNSVQAVWGLSIQVSTFFQVLGANAIIYLGLFFTRKLEIKYAILEFLLDITYVIGILFIFSVFFDWFTDNIWILAVMAVVLYILGQAINIIKTRKYADEMNELLQKRKKKLLTM